MVSAYPRRPEVEPPNRDGATVTLSGDVNGAVFDALGSATSRELLRVLTAEPLPASDLADEVGTSLQNVNYHLGKLESADLIERVGTWYSERGCEMAVYASTAEQVTIDLDG